MIEGSRRRAHRDKARLYVFHGRPLRPGVKLADTALFEDDEWPMAPAALQKQQRGLTLRFNTITASYTEPLRHLAYTALSGDLPADEPRPTIGSIVTMYYNIAVFFRWAEDNHGGRPLSLLSPDQLLLYQRHLLEAYPSPTRRHALRAAVAYLWRYRASVGEHALRFDPRTLSGWKEPYAPVGENKIARIPEEVHGPLLVWAMRFVDDFSDDILQAVEKWEALRQRGPRRRSPAGNNLRNLTRFLDTAYAEGRPLPGFNGELSYVALARTIGCNRRALDDHTQLLERAVQALGVSDYSYLGIDVRGRLDGEPWSQGFSLDPARDDSLTVMTQMLQAACYVVIAFLSGMRDSEVKHLRAGCLETRLDHDGTPYRWLVSSLAFKGEDDPSGVPATWVVGGPAARAISVLERVHRERARGRTDYLFAPIKSGPGAGSSGRRGNIAMTSAGTNRQLNRFVTWVNQYCAERHRPDAIPMIDSQPWRLSTSQFRRTLAWYIARRPGGSIAGAIAYRHHSIQMFEGYAGTSDSGFRGEVEAEAAIARGEELLAIIDQNDHTRLSGPSAEEAERRLSTMQDDPRFAGTVTTDRKRFLRIVTRYAPAVYPGKYVTCVYAHEKALCRAGVSDTESTPDLSNCKPLTCRNVALSPANREAWRNELQELNELLEQGHLLPPALEMRLRQRQEQVRRLLTTGEIPSDSSD